MESVKWDGGVISTEVLDASIRVICTGAQDILWQCELAVDTGGQSWIRACGLSPMGDRLILSVVCEHDRGGTPWNSQILCLAPGGRLLWRQLLDGHGGEFGMLRLSKGLAVVSAWDFPMGSGLSDMQARLLDIDTGEVLKTHVIPVVKDLKRRRWEYAPYIYGHGGRGPLYFGVRVTATAAPEVPADWGHAV